MRTVRIRQQPITFKRPIRLRRGGDARWSDLSTEAARIAQTRSWAILWGGTRPAIPLSVEAARAFHDPRCPLSPLKK
jgi:hypothetical protein